MPSSKMTMKVPKKQLALILSLRLPFKMSPTLPRIRPMGVITRWIVCLTFLITLAARETINQCTLSITDMIPIPFALMCKTQNPTPAVLNHRHLASGDPRQSNQNDHPNGVEPSLYHRGVSTPSPPYALVSSLYRLMTVYNSFPGCLKAHYLAACLTAN